MESLSDAASDSTTSLTGYYACICSSVIRSILLFQQHTMCKYIHRFLAGVELVTQVYKQMRLIPVYKTHIC